MRTCWYVAFMFFALQINGLQPVCSAQESQSTLLVHYMPWYQAKPYSETWGWHWTMNAFDPEKIEDDRRAIASKFYPTIGPYDSSDPAVIEFHLLTMKVAGIRGIIVDWYGLQDFRDYALLHENTSRLIPYVERFGMLFAICYEDQTIPALVEAGNLDASGRIDHATREIKWLGDNWFSKPNYLQVAGKPVLLSFGQTGLSDSEWQATLLNQSKPIYYLSQHHRRTSAVGVFDWPVPQEGLAATERFIREHGATVQAEKELQEELMPVVFPRFVDIYKEANVHPSWGQIADDQGATFQKTLELALSTNSRLVQLATWNDWGEGTVLEPSVEFGFRDLKVLQKRLEKQPGAKNLYSEADFELPLKLYELRKSEGGKSMAAELDQIALDIASGDVLTAAKSLQRIGARR